MSKKKIITTASAVALAAVLALGGTLAYYQDKADDDVSNTFVDQGNSVSISESDVDNDGSEQSNTYSIIPGTTDTKDPVVTAEYTLDSYVYVTVDDTTGDYITWDIANGWTQLDGHSDVYYMLLKTVQYDSESEDWTETGESTGIYTYTYTDSDSNETALTYSCDSGTGTYTVANSDGKTLYTYKVETNSNGIDVYTAEIPVIYGDTVTYSSEIENDTFTGYGSTVSLDFMAYIIQASLDDGTDGDDDYGESEYSSEQLAYYAAVGGMTYNSNIAYVEIEASGETTLAAALANAVSEASADATTVIVLPEAEDDSEAVALSAKLSVTSDVVIDLNGNTLTLSDEATDTAVVQASGEDTTLVLTDGSITLTSDDGSSAYGVRVASDASVTLENVDVLATTYALYINDANLEATDCKLEAVNSRAVLITTYFENAAGDYTANCEVTLTDCEITATGSSYAAGVQSQGSNIELTIDSCIITSNYYGVYQNGAYSPVTIRIIDTTITDTGSGGVYVSNSSADGREKQTLVIDNCTITGPTAVEFKHTNATITDSVLNASTTPTSSGTNGNGSCTAGYSLACTTNGANDYVTGTVVVTDCELNVVSDGETSGGYYFVYQVADDSESSVTINGTSVTNYNSYGG